MVYDRISGRITSQVMMSWLVGRAWVAPCKKFHSTFQKAHEYWLLAMVAHRAMPTLTHRQAVFMRLDYAPTESAYGKKIDFTACESLS